MRATTLLIAAALAASAAAEDAAKVLDAGVRLEVEMVDALSSDGSFAKERFRAALHAARARDGKDLDLPAGLTLEGTVANAVSSREVGQLARLTLRFERVIGASGIPSPVDAFLEAVLPEGDAWRITTVAGGTVIIDRLRFFPALRGVLVDRARDEAIAGLASQGGATLVAPAPGTPIEVPKGARLEVRLRGRLRLP